MKLGVMVGLGSGHIVLDGDPGPLQGKGHSSLRLSKFRGAGFACVHIIRVPCLLWPNGWVVQDAPPQESGGGHSSPQFSAYAYYGQTAGWIKMKLGMEVGLGPGHSCPLLQRGTAPQFSAHVCCGHTAGWIRCHLVGR